MDTAGRTLDDDQLSEDSQPQPVTQEPERRDGALPSLDAAIEAMNLAKEVANMVSAEEVFGSVAMLLTMIRVGFLLLDDFFWFTCNQNSMANEIDYVELGLACADTCKVLDRGINGRKPEDLNQSVHEAISQLTRSVKSVVQDSGSSPTILLITEPWPRSGRRLLRKID